MSVNTDPGEKSPIGNIEWVRNQVQMRPPTNVHMFRMDVPFEIVVHAAPGTISARATAEEAKDRLLGSVNALLGVPMHDMAYDTTMRLLGEPFVRTA